MNEFFRCPKLSSGQLIISIIFSIIIFSGNLVHKHVGTICTGIYMAVSFCWVIWNIYNLKQSPKCYTGFPNNNGWSYLNPFPKSL